MSFIKVSADKLAPKIRHELGTALRGAVDEHTNDAKQLTPVDTGNLKGSWKSNTTGLDAVIENDADYAAYQEYGTRYQAGREMVGMRSGTAGKEIAQKVERRL